MPRARGPGARWHILAGEIHRMRQRAVQDQMEHTSMAWFGSHQDAVGQALADTRAVLAGGISLRDPIALSVRLGDLSRSNGLLSLEASLQSLERYSRLVHVGRRSTRSLALATLAADIESGYLLLDRRASRWGRSTPPPGLGGEAETRAVPVPDTGAPLR